MMFSVRSLASVAYRKALDDDEVKKFDFFTVDIDEDLGALYGPVLQVRIIVYFGFFKPFKKLYFE